jgi:hypothetical protein
MVTEKTTMSLSSKKEYLRNVNGRYQRAGREHKSRILDEFCANCGYHRKFALRLLNRPLQASRRRPGPNPKYDPAQLLPPLKTIWLCAEQPCSKLLKATLPLWLDFLPELAPALRCALLIVGAVLARPNQENFIAITFPCATGRRRLPNSATSKPIRGMTFMMRL